MTREALLASAMSGGACVRYRPEESVARRRAEIGRVSALGSQRKSLSWPNVGEAPFAVVCILVRLLVDQCFAYYGFCIRASRPGLWNCLAPQPRPDDDRGDFTCQRLQGSRY